MKNVIVSKPVTVCLKQEVNSGELSVLWVNHDDSSMSCHLAILECFEETFISSIVIPYLNNKAFLADMILAFLATKPPHFICIRLVLRSRNDCSLVLCFDVGHCCGVQGQPVFAFLYKIAIASMFCLCPPNT